MSNRHSCEGIEKIKLDWSGNRLLYRKDLKNTHVYIGMDAGFLNDIFIQHWGYEGRKFYNEKKRYRIKYCPFCGEEIPDLYPDRKLNTITFNEKGEAVMNQNDN